MLTAAARIAPRGVYVAGNTTSSSGLTVTVVKDASGDFALEAGALVMGDQVRLLSDCMLIALEAGALVMGDQVRLLSDGPRSASLSVPLGASLMTSQSLPNCHNSLMTQAECPAELALHADSRPATHWHCMLIRVRPIRAAAASTSSIR